MKKFSFILAIIFLISVFSGCKKSEEADFKIVTSCYPVYIMTLNVVKDIPGVEVVNMCENNTGCLHNFQLRSDDLKKIEKSSAFVINGGGMELFVDKITSELPKVKIVDSSTGIELLKDECHHHHEDEEESEHEHCHHEENPHIWMSVSNCMKQVENISSGLAKIDSSHAELYEKNAKIYTEKLSSLKNKINAGLENITDKNIITFHEAFPYFAKEFGLNIVGVINHEPGEEPTVKEIKDTIDLIKTKSVKCIFTEPQYPENTAKTIASETGVSVYALDPAVTGDGSADSYLNAMEKNLEVLEKVLR